MRALTPWRANPPFATLHEELDELFDRFFGRELGWGLRPATATAFIPAIESFVRDDKLVIRADLPGIDPKEVDLAVEGDRLIIRGERKNVYEDADRLYREVAYGRFERSVQLPAGVDADSIEATYHDGVLEVTMAAPKGMVAKKVPITVH